MNTAAINREIGQRVRDTRKKQKLYLWWICERIGVHTETMNETERGIRRLKCDEAIELAALFGVSVEWLLTGKGPKAKRRKKVTA